MSQEKIQFSLVLKEDDHIDMNIDGSMSELVQLIASAIVHEPEIEKVIMFTYSDKKNSANFKDEYSVWKPPTNSPSASAKSNGALFVSPTIDIA